MLCEASIANVPFFVGAIFQTNVCSFSDKFLSSVSGKLWVSSLFLPWNFAKNLGKSKKRRKQRPKNEVEEERTRREID